MTNTLKLGTPFRLCHKIMLIMRLTTVMLIASLMQVSAAGYGQYISLSHNKASLKNIMREIKSKSGYNFVITEDLLAKARPVSINATNLPVEKVLQSIFEHQNLVYSIDRNTIIIKEKGISVLDNLVAFFQKINLNGKIIGEDGKPLAGALIRIKGTSKIVTANDDGEFTLQGVNEEDILFVSYVGYLSKEVKVTENLKIIKLELNTSKLDEVQVIAYGTTTKRLNTGSVGTLNATEIEKQPVNNILDAMIGRIAGLQITQNSGIQGAAPVVQIRGRSSISTGTSPLYIVDGVPITETQSLNNQSALDFQGLNLLTSLNTADIESVNVLKDADATAIYGSRGTNGVILITTKRGKPGKMVTNVKFSSGVQQVGHFMDMLSVEQYIALRKEAFANDNIMPTVANAPDLLVWDRNIVHDWQKELIGKTANSNDFGLSFSGGGANVKYFISTGYHKEGTVMPGDSKMIRKSFLSGITASSTNKKFNLEARAGYSLNTLNLLPTDLVSSINLAPHYPLYNSDGSPNWSVTTFPLSYTLQSFSAPTKSFSGNAQMSYEVIEGLRLKLTGGISEMMVNSAIESPLYSKDPATATTGTSTRQDIDNDNWILEPQLEYRRNFRQHHLTALFGSTFQKKASRSLNLIGTNFSNDNLIGNIGSAGTITTTSSNTPYAYSAVFGRLSYDYNKEWLANVTFRRDGSSRFGEGYKFGNFGALGLGWVFTEKMRIKEHLTFLSYGKIRGSYGITGNDQITDFQYLNTYRSVSAGYNGSAALQPSGISNPELRWETTKKLEAAVELGFLKDKLLLTGAFFRNRSDNQLVSNNVSPQTGFLSYYFNFPGLVQNQGIEIELSTKNIQRSFTWNTSLTFSKSTNKLLRYENLASSNYSQSLAIGQSLTLLQAYVFKGLDAKGVPVFEDRDGNNVINFNDRVYAGNKDPMYGGISNDFGFKGFSFNFFIRYDKLRGRLAYLPSRVPATFNANNTSYVLGRWQFPGDETNTIIPRATTIGNLYNNSNYLNSDQLIVDRHVFRLSNVALGYNLPYRIISKLKISQLQVFVNGQNLYVFDKHGADEFDPQSGNSSLPPLRTIVFGINASF